SRDWSSDVCSSDLVAPWQFCRIAIGKNTDLVAIDYHVITIDGDSTREAAMCSVILSQVGIGLGIAQIIDRDDFNIMLFATFIVSTQYITADAAVAVNCNTNGHYILSCFIKPV